MNERKGPCQGLCRFDAIAAQIRTRLLWVLERSSDFRCLFPMPSSFSGINGTGTDTHTHIHTDTHHHPHVFVSPPECVETKTSSGVPAGREKTSSGQCASEMNKAKNAVCTPSSNHPQTSSQGASLSLAGGIPAKRVREERRSGQRPPLGLDLGEFMLTFFPFNDG
ncbi:hypothetical protein LZ31DRAFT_287002 [Colletotrichum somersetense]|nr:hypothetical protein LZ31DRAFT_287002 [Colletotrichum somersetense]